MKTGRLLTIFLPLAVAGSAYGFDKASEHPGLTWNQPQQDIVFTSVGDKTRIEETAVGKVHVLNCPKSDVRLLDQYKVLWPIPFPVPHEIEAVCGSELAAPGTFALMGRGRVVGLDYK
jgi:hypothetical protein